MNPVQRIERGDCVEVMAGMEPASVDAVVCDPPYGLEFMGKEWDRLGAVAAHPDDGEGPWGRQNRVRFGRSVTSAQAWHEQWARAVYRVLKPGGHLLAFGGSRTYHRMACAVEDAGFEIRDQIMWLYGMGFPKSLDVGKAIDRAAGAKRDPVTREVFVEPDLFRDEQRGEVVAKRRAGLHGGSGTTVGCFTSLPGNGPDEDGLLTVTAPATDAARQWSGWGTALKPAHEPIVVARKPLIGTVAANVQRHGTGAINVDGCRIEGVVPSVPQPKFNSPTGAIYGMKADVGRSGERSHAEGRWPANVILDAEAGAMLGEQTGNGTARFFYCPKASRKEREAGLLGDERQNKHPTVKPVALMRYLVRLVTPPGGTVLDPFLGSGTTLMAAALEGFSGIGIERELEYVEIARARVGSVHERGLTVDAQEALPLGAL